MFALTSRSSSSSPSAPRNPNLLDAYEPVEDEPKDTDDVQTPRVVDCAGESESEPVRVVYDASCFVVDFVPDRTVFGDQHPRSCAALQRKLQLQLRHARYAQV